MLRSSQYTINEETGRVEVTHAPGDRLLPVGFAGFLHVILFGSIFFIDIDTGTLQMPDQTDQEVAFMVETYVEPIVEEEVIEEEPEPEPISEPEPEPIEEVEPDIAEIDEVIEEPQEIKEPSKPRVTFTEPPKKPEPKPKPEKKIKSRPIPHVKSNPRPLATIKKSKAKLGFIKPVYPEYLRNPAPPYPKKAKRRRLEGVVELIVSVSTKGRVLSLKVLKSSGHKSLDKSAVQTVRTWRFLPAKKNGKVVESDVIVPIRFRLKYDSD